MSPGRSHFVTLSQQVLALGVVVAALVPATGVVSIDVVAVRPAAPRVGVVSELAAHPLGGRDRVAPFW